MRRMLLSLRNSAGGGSEGGAARRRQVSGWLLPLGGLALLLVPTMAAQGQAHDPVERSLVPPEIIMENQRTLGVTDDQREQIKTAVAKAQGEFTEMKWDLQARMEKLSDMIGGGQADRNAVLAQLDSVLEIETLIKRTHLAMLLQIREILTAEQYRKALDLKRRLPRPQHGPQGPAQPMGPPPRRE